MARTWVRRGALIGACVLAGAGAWAFSNWDSIQTQLAVRRLKSASTDEERLAQAEALAALENGPRELLPLCRDADPAIRAAAVAAVAKHLESLPPSDPRGNELALALLDSPDRESIAPLLPAITQRCGAVHGAKCRAIVADALKSPSVEARVAAIRAAVHPGVALRAEILPLLSAPEAEVRRAALFAVGPAADVEAVIGDEELFRWLHDPDADVRTICRSALASRGRSDTEIMLGKRLVDPDANERLNLLLALRDDDELHDVEPWLERLGRDIDPGVRAGAARVMLEINAERMRPVPAWVARLATDDPSPSVRRVAAHHAPPPPIPLDPAVRRVDGP